MSVANVAVLWVLHRLEATCGGAVVLGVRGEEWVEETRALGSRTLGDDDMAAIGAVLDQGRAPAGCIYSRER